MIWNVKEIKTLLAAKMEIVGLDENSKSYLFEFSDDRLYFQLACYPSRGTVQLTANATQGNSSQPVFEYSFMCDKIEVGQGLFGNNPAIFFYERYLTVGGLRLTLNFFETSYWYICANANHDPYGRSE